MKKIIFYCLLSLLRISEINSSLTLSTEEAWQIGERIWKNECAGTTEGLTSWNKGESFASLGIGHFIWYSHGKNEQYEETFPDLLDFLQKQGAIFPAWLNVKDACPWKSREHFQEEFHTAKMNSLRQFLLDTKTLQAIYIVSRLEKILPTLLSRCSKSDLEKVSEHLAYFTRNAKGIYALVDYLNFKGNGTSSKESYKGQGWGLLQVLQAMPFVSKEPLSDFVEAAKFLLKKRVENSPAERNEGQWLKGWFKRLDTYRE